ncbi:Integral membrane protein TerC family [hydrothermal vent metagenome]|uniref:Integral membrane protein TerC family n=1 Tax=hydrothermal vent metagenome TaxID=652676 RepID=A0A3B0TV52_9ZZZZ
MTAHQRRAKAALAAFKPGFETFRVIGSIASNILLIAIDFIWKLAQITTLAGTLFFVFISSSRFHLFFGENAFRRVSFNPMPSFIDPGMLGAFIQVVLIDLVLAGDNAVVIGLAAASLEPSMRRKAILYGIIAATVLRVVLAVLTTQLLDMIGLLLAGGLLLLWVCWKMWQELRNAAHEQTMADQALAAAALAGADFNQDKKVGAPVKIGNFRQAVFNILIADISMSLDNVLAVAGAAREHPVILAFGLVLSIALMGVAAAFIARLLGKHHWIAYIGLGIILFVAAKMIFNGAEEVFEQLAAPAMATI